jgi:hypothetical protein
MEITETLRILGLDLLEFPQVADVALRKPGKCFRAMYLPPGFDGRKFPLPQATKEAFAPPVQFFHSFPGEGRNLRHKAGKNSWQMRKYSLQYF